MKTVTRYTFAISIMVFALLIGLLPVPVRGQGQSFNSSISSYITPWSCGQGRAVSGTTAIDLNEIYIPAQLTFSKMAVIINTLDAGNNYSWGIYSLQGQLLANNTAGAVATTGSIERTNLQNSVTLAPGNYLIAAAGDNVTALFGYGGSTGMQQFTTATVSAAGVLPAAVVVTSLAGTAQQIQRSLLCISFR